MRLRYNLKKHDRGGCNWGDKIHRKFVIYMSKYLFHVLIGSDAAFPLHLSRLQLEAAAMTPHVRILDTRGSRRRPNSNRQGGEKGKSLPLLLWTSSLTPNLFLNEAVTAVQMNTRIGFRVVRFGSAERHRGGGDSLFLLTSVSALAGSGKTTR